MKELQLTKKERQQVRGVLRKVQRLFSKPEKWTHECFARTASGDSCTYNAGKAVCWCLLGGIYLHTEACGTFTDSVLDVVWRALPRSARNNPDEIRDDIADWNDRSRRTVDQVREVLERALELSA